MKLNYNILGCVTLLLLFTVSCSQPDNTQTEESSDLIELMQQIYPLHRNHPDSVHVLLNAIWAENEHRMTGIEKALFYRLRGIAYRNRIINNPVAAEANLLKSLHYLDSLDDDYWAIRARIVRDIGATHLQAGNFNSALDFYQQALVILGNEQYPGLLHSIYMDKGTALAGMGNVDSSLYYTQLAIDIAREENFKSGEAGGLINLAMAFAGVGKLSQAEENIRRAIPIFAELGYQRRLRTAYRNLSLVLVSQYRSEEALLYAQKSDEIAAIMGIPPTAMAPYYSNRAGIYLEQGNYRNSLEMLYRALELHSKMPQVEPIGEARSSIGLLYSKMGNFDKALLYTNEALRAARENGLLRLEARVQRNLVSIHAARGNINGIMAAIQAERTLRDKLFSEESSRILHEMQVRYQTELKEILLAQQAKDIQQQARNIRLQYIIITLLAIISILSILIILFQRRKAQNTMRIVQQYEQLLGYKQKEEAGKITRIGNVTKNLSSDLEHLFEVEKIYRQQGLSVNDLVEKLGTNHKYLLQIFKEYQKNFNDFVNTYRVAEARDMLKDSKYNHYTVQAISEMVGFSSLSVFYTSFKQEVGVAPAEYRKVIRKMKDKTT